MECLLLTLLLEACAYMKETDRERERQCGVFCTESKVTITANLLVACVTSETERILQRTMQCQ